MMLRILISMALIFAVVWYMLKDGNDNNKLLEQQLEKVDLARDAAAVAEQAAASIGEQGDATRDEAMEAIAPPPDATNPEQ